jgi:trimethylamine--corrinoid protein Co-methyltransferase
VLNFPEAEEMSSTTPDIISFDTRHKSRLLSDSQLERLKSATLQVLAEVGVNLPSRRGLEVFADHGAQVDMEKEIVRIPPDLVLKSMATAPRSFTLAGREPRFDLVLDGSHSYLATDGCGVTVVDAVTREQRPSCKEDVARMAQVCDNLPLVSFFWPLVSAQDYGIAAPVHECHAGLTNTLKHVRGGTTVHPRLARYIIELAAAVAGNTQALRERPPICANICTIAPLAHDHDGMETGLMYAEAGIPASYMAMPTMGSTAPATPLGALVTADAEVISAMVLVQLLYPGAPVFHSIMSSLMDPRTGGYISDLSIPMSQMAVELAHAWNVPSLGGGSTSSDAPELGWESGTSSGVGSILIPLLGGEVCGYIGMTAGSMVMYPEQVILDHETCMHAHEYFQGFEFDEADLALDVIAEVGPASHYLLQKHTRQHIRDFRLSPLVRQKDDQGDFRDPRQVALEQYLQIESSHQPEPLPEATSQELERIMAAVDIEAANIEKGN